MREKYIIILVLVSLFLLSGLSTTDEFHDEEYVDDIPLGVSKTSVSSSALSQKETVTITVSSGASGSVSTVNTYNTSRTMLLWSIRTSAVSDDMRYFAFFIDMSDSTHLSWRRNSATTTYTVYISVQVIEFAEGTGVEVTRVSGLNPTASTQYHTFGETYPLGEYFVISGAVDDDTVNYVNRMGFAYPYSSTQIAYSLSAPTDDCNEVWAQIVYVPDSTVYTDAFAVATATANDDLPTTVDTTRSWILLTSYYSGGANIAGYFRYIGVWPTFVDSDTISATFYYTQVSGRTRMVRWQVIEWPEWIDKVQRVNDFMANSDSTEDTTITAVDVDNTIAWSDASYGAFMGQGGESSDLQDEFDACYTISLTSSTNIRATRVTTTTGVDLRYNVVTLEFGSITTESGLNWLTGWGERKWVNITGQSGCGTNYQVMFDVEYGSGSDTGNTLYVDGCQTDFGDIRFTHGDGNTSLDYWLEEYTASGDASFWVEVQENLNNNVTIFIYWDTSGTSSSTSNGTNTFIFFDDFETNDLTDRWDTAEALWSTTSSSPKYGTYCAKADGGSTGRSLKKDDIGTWTTDIMIHAWYKQNDLSGTRYPLTYVRDSSDVASYALATVNNDFASYNSVDSWEYYSLNTIVANTWQRIEVGYDWSNTERDFFLNRVARTSLPNTDVSNVAVVDVTKLQPLTSSSTVDDYWFDDFYVRKWLASGEPSVDTTENESFNTAPLNDQAPTCADLHDTDHFYAEYAFYSVIVYISDTDGYADITTIDLYGYSDDRGTNYWILRYSEDSNTFSEQSDTSDYVNLNTGTSSATRTGNDIDATFEIEFNWAHPDVADMDMRILVTDSASDTDDDYYEADWQIETRLDYSITPSVTDDDAGTVDRGDLNEAFTIDGTLKYYGSALYPDSADVDVWISGSEYGASAGPWSDTTLTSGAFSIICYADNVVGQDTYTTKPVAEGAGSGSSSLYHTSDLTATYIADRIQVQSYTVVDVRVNINDNVNIDVLLYYDYNNSQVIDGTVTINGYSASHQGSGVWRITRTSASVTSITYDTIVVSGNTHGITIIDQNGQSELVIWDSYTVSFTVGDNRININTNATVSYTVISDYDAIVYDGTVNLNYSTWTQASAQRQGFTVSSLAGDDTYGITAISTNDADYIIWDSYTVSFTVGDNRININTNATVSYTVISDYDSISYDGTVNLNYSTWTQATVQRQGFTVSSLAGDDTYGITAISINDADYVIWDRVQVVSYTASDSRDNINDNVNIDVTLIYDYDDAQVTAGTITINGYSAIHQGSGVWRITRTSATVTSVTYDTVAGTGSLYGITVFDQNSQSTSVIWDRIQITGILANTTLLLSGEYVLLNVSMIYDYDDSVVGAGTFTLEGLSLTWSGTIWELTDMESSPVTNTYNTVVGSGSLYGITVIDMNGMSIDVTWEDNIIQVTLTINYGWTVVGYNVTISYSGIYLPSGNPWSGVPTINSSGSTMYPSYSTTGLRAFTTTSVTDPLYGISSFTSNTVSVTWDSIVCDSITYSWEMFDLIQVQMVLVTGTFSWEINGTDIGSGHTIKVYVNSSQQVDTTTDGSSQIATQRIGPFGQSWYYGHFVGNATTTVGARTFIDNWWDTTITIPVEHTIHLASFTVNEYDEYFWFTWSTVWNNGTFTLWDNTTLITYIDADPGTYRLDKSIIPYLHNLTILINCSDTGGHQSEQTRDFSTSDYWLWLNYYYYVGDGTLQGLYYFAVASVEHDYQNDFVPYSPFYAEPTFDGQLTLVFYGALVGWTFGQTAFVYYDDVVDSAWLTGIFSYYYGAKVILVKITWDIMRNIFGDYYFSSGTFVNASFYTDDGGTEYLNLAKALEDDPVDWTAYWDFREYFPYFDSRTGDEVVGEPSIIWDWPSNNVTMLTPYFTQFCFLSNGTWASGSGVSDISIIYDIQAGLLNFGNPPDYIDYYNLNFTALYAPSAFYFDVWIDGIKYGTAIGDLFYDDNGAHDDEWYLRVFLYGVPDDLQYSDKDVELRQRYGFMPFWKQDNLNTYTILCYTAIYTLDTDIATIGAPLNIDIEFWNPLESTIRLTGISNAEFNYYLYLEGNYQSEYGTITVDTQGAFSFTVTRTTTTGSHNYAIYCNSSTITGSRWINFTEYVSNVLYIQDPVLTETTTQVHLSAIVTIDCIYYIFDNEEYQAETDSITAGSFEILYSKLSTIGAHEWAIKFNTSTYTRWINGSYLITGPSDPTDLYYGFGYALDGALTIEYETYAHNEEMFQAKMFFVIVGNGLDNITATVLLKEFTYNSWSYTAPGYYIMWRGEWSFCVPVNSDSFNDLSALSSYALNFSITYNGYTVIPVNDYYREDYSSASARFDYLMSQDFLGEGTSVYDANFLVPFSPKAAYAILMENGSWNTDTQIYYDVLAWDWPSTYYEITGSTVSMRFSFRIYIDGTWDGNAYAFGVSRWNSTASNNYIRVDLYGIPDDLRYSGSTIRLVQIIGHGQIHDCAGEAYQKYCIISAYIAIEDVETNPPLDIDIEFWNPLESTIRITGVANAVFDYYVYHEGVYNNEYGTAGSETDFSFTIARNLGIGEHNFQIYFNSSTLSGSRWFNFTDEVSTVYSWMFIEIFDSNSEEVDYVFDIYVNGSIVYGQRFYNRTDSDYNITLTNKFGDLVYSQILDTPSDYIFDIQIAMWSFKIHSQVVGEFSCTVTSNGGGTQSEVLFYNEIWYLYLFEASSYQITWTLTETQTYIQGQGAHYWPSTDANNLDASPVWYSPIEPAGVEIDEYSIAYVVGQIPDPSGGGDANETAIAKEVLSSLAIPMLGAGGGIVAVFTLLAYLVLVSKRKTTTTTSTTTSQSSSPRPVVPSYPGDSRHVSQQPKGVGSRQQPKKKKGRYRPQ